MSTSLPVFIIKRLFVMMFLVFSIASIVFFLAHASPYDPVQQILGQKTSPLKRAAMRHLFGLDQPLWRQYINYLGNALHGNLGYAEENFYFGQSVSKILLRGLPVSVKLGGYALALSLLIGMPIGLLSALRHNSSVDHTSQTVMMIAYAVPPFVIIPLLQLLVADHIPWLPVAGWGDTGWQGIREMILPVSTLALGLSGYFAKSFRSFMLEVLSQDYIRTARAKGLRERWVIYLHALKNTLLPLSSILGPTIAFLITGAFITEFYFDIPGVGYITITSVTASDYPVIEATTIILAVAIVVVNMLTDIFYAIVDPRVRL